MNTYVFTLSFSLTFSNNFSFGNETRGIFILFDKVSRTNYMSFELFSFKYHWLWQDLIIFIPISHLKPIF